MDFRPRIPQKALAPRAVILRGPEQGAEGRDVEELEKCVDRAEADAAHTDDWATL
jgi:hypothetical protein